MTRLCASMAVTALLGAPEAPKSGIFIRRRRDGLSVRRFHRSLLRSRAMVRNLRDVDNSGYVDKMSASLARFCGVLGERCRVNVDGGDEPKKRARATRRAGVLSTDTQ